MEHNLTAKLSWVNKNYYLIYLNGRAWRVCHKDQLQDRYPDAKIEE